MKWILVVVIVVFVIYVMRAKKKPQVSLVHLPDQFVVFDLETTGLSPEKNEIIEFGAIRVNRDSNEHETFQQLVIPFRNIDNKINWLTGISQTMLDEKGEPIEAALREFLAFIGDAHLVSFNSSFDMGFLQNAAAKYSITVSNPVSCALKMARRAWPGRKSYRLADLAKDGNLSSADTHRALGDCQRTLIVYAAAASKLGAIQ